jgi:probable HAF family extracellular repeat protein
MKRMILLFIRTCLLLFAATSFAQMYTVIDLGTLGGNQSAGLAINNAGQVTGYSLLPNGYPHAFRYSGGVMKDLGTIGGVGISSHGRGINISGQVTGNGDSHAFITQGDTMMGLTVFGEDFSSIGQGINDVGQVTGYGDVGLGLTHAFLYNNGTTQDLGTLGGCCSYGYGINGSGQVTGGAMNVGDNPEVHAFLYSNGTMTDLGALPGGPGQDQSWGFAINSAKEVAGYSYCYSGIHAFVYRNGSMIDLGTLSGGYSYAFAINTVGQVVGLSDGRSFLYAPAGIALVDLNAVIAADSGWMLGDANGINDSGQITGSGYINGQMHGFLLTPIYKTFVQQPINADGSSVFPGKRGVVPVKFTLTQYDVPICPSLPATISVTRTSGGTLGAIDENTYSMAADNGSNFRIDQNACQYVYNLAASPLGIGTYRVDISINGIMVGHAVFALK